MKTAAKMNLSNVEKIIPKQIIKENSFIGSIILFSLRSILFSIYQIAERNKQVFLGCIMQLCVCASNASPPAILRLNVSGQSMHSETAVYFDSACTFNYNNQYDAVSLGVSPGYVNIVTVFDSMDFQIKGLPLLMQNMSIPLKVNTGIIGIYQLYATDIQNLPAGACLFLHDNYTNSDHDLRTGVYTCNISDTESIARYVININISLLGISGSSINPTCLRSGNGQIIANSIMGVGPWNYYWKDSVNNILKISLNKNYPDTFFNVNGGLYKIDINTNNTCDNGSLSFTLSGTQSSLASFTPSKDTISVNDIQGILFTNNSLNASRYWWEFGDGMGGSDTNPNYYYVNPGTYVITLTAFGDGCNDTSFLSREIIVVSEITGVTQIKENSNTVLINKDANGYYVKFDNYKKTGAVISVSDLLGKKINVDVEIEVLNEKVYLNISSDENKILLISVITSTGQKTYKKIIQEQ